MDDNDRCVHIYADGDVCCLRRDSHRGMRFQPEHAHAFVEPYVEDSPARECSSCHREMTALESQHLTVCDDCWDRDYKSCEEVTPTAKEARDRWRAIRDAPPVAGSAPRPLCAECGDTWGAGVHDYAHPYVDPRNPVAEPPKPADETCVGSCDDRKLSAARVAAGHTLCVACQSLWDRAVAAGRRAGALDMRERARGVARDREDSAITALIAMRKARREHDHQLQAKSDEAALIADAIARLEVK